MAKVLQKTYVFTPGSAGSGTILLPGNVQLSDLLLITNTTDNVILYNFSDPAFAGTTAVFSRTTHTSFPQTLHNSDGFTTITLAANTTGQSSTDRLQIFTDNPTQVVKLGSIGVDAFERMRIANPQSMLDADFEYGLQPTKWQVLSLMRGYPSIFESPGTDILVTSVTTDASTTASTGTSASLITVNTVEPHGLIRGQAVTIKGLANTILGFARAEGTFIINSIVDSDTFTYYAKAKVGSTNGEVCSTSYTQLRRGGFFTGAAVASATFSANTSTSPNTITATFPNPHGLLPGQTIVIDVTSTGSNHQLAEGPFYVETVPTHTTITFTARDTGTVGTSLTGIVYARPDCFFTHRAFDGGVLIGTGGPSHGSHAIRQSKKYIRYQSGKAINFNTGVLFAPSYDVRSVTSVGTTIGSTITIQTDDVDHGLQAGAVINLDGVLTSGYDGQYTVTSVADERTITVTATQVLGSTTASISTPCVISLVSWVGSTVRLGTFDDQNGQYWQFDGQTLAVGYKSSTFQLAGVVAVTPDSNAITGTNTRFLSQLSEGERIVIRGMTHVVTNVVSDTEMYVTPDFRGFTAQDGVKIAKTIEYNVPQIEWNVDRCDGTNSPFNPSGFLINVNKMQMCGMQWTWYGAGFIEWMIRGPSGDFIVVHRQKHGNVNTEAYMRSGNQPVRYEVINESARTSTTAAHTSSSTTLTVADTSWFPPAGTLWMDGEVISYTGKTATTFTGCTRATTYSQFAGGASRTFRGFSSANANTAINTGVILINQTATPIISHWGSAYLQDGGFDVDRGYIFNYSATNLLLSSKRVTAFLIRLAPSVSNAIIGDLGTRELLNRAQLLLEGLEITAGGGTGTNLGIVVEGVLNPSNYPSTVTTQVATPATANRFSISGTTLTILSGATVTGSFAVGQAISGINTTGTAIAPGTVITALGTGTGGVGTYTINNSQTVTSAAADTTQFLYASNIFWQNLQGTFGGGLPSFAQIAVAGDGGPFRPDGFLQFSTTAAGVLNTAGSTILTVAAGGTTGVAIGDDVFAPAVTGLQGNTFVTAINAGANQVTLSKPLVAAVTASSVITFARNTYAKPGETVFSFISAPQNRDALDLTPLKELTNTPIGGRGTFPNGPDVLAINVYLTQGTIATTAANLVLRWSEAQA
jgi:hypothetical protein